MKTMSEITKPTAPAIIKITPNVDSRKSWFYTTLELCAVVAQCTIAPTTAEIPLRTIPGNPMMFPFIVRKEQLHAKRTWRFNSVDPTNL